MSKEEILLGLAKLNLADRLDRFQGIIRVKAFRKN